MKGNCSLKPDPRNAINLGLKQANAYFSFSMPSTAFAFKPSRVEKEKSPSGRILGGEEEFGECSDHKTWLQLSEWFSLK